MPTEIATPPAKRPRLTKAHNLTLRPSVAAEASRIADQRYGISLSAMTDELLEKEISMKRGMLPRHRRTTVPA